MFSIELNRIAHISSIRSYNSCFISNGCFMFSMKAKPPYFKDMEPHDHGHYLDKS